jgi:uncharacterized membrane protein
MAERGRARILLAGESWSSYGIHVKGAASYTTATYEEGADALIGALREGGLEVDYLPNHAVVEGFPYDAETLLESYDAIILSDLPSDSLLLPRAVFVEGQTRPNRLSAIGDFVNRGGGLLMVGGYMSFSGFEGRARYGMTPLAEVLPVEMLNWDDRIEVPEGVVALMKEPHVVVEGIEGEWPPFLGYNRARARVDAQVVLAAGNGDPLLVVGAHGAGRVAAFMSDCAPHWGSPAFMGWEFYDRFWTQLVRWLSSRDEIA